MYAIFEDGSRQYKVSEGTVVKVDWREAEIGSQIVFPRVLLYQEGNETKIGQPVLDGMRVAGTVVDYPSTKLYVQHFRRRKNYRRLRGHRQHYVAVQVYAIVPPGQETPPVPVKKQKDEQPAGATPAPTAAAGAEAPKT
jgi:large subunit ribosomal protein L21